MVRRRQIYEGKAKILYEGPEPGTLIQYFKDDATAFNAQKRGTISGKGVLNNRISEHIFTALATIGVPTHFIRRLNMREQLIRQVEIVPIEVVVRNVAAGSLSKRLGIEEGTQLPRTIIEYYYKDDALGDPMIADEHIACFGWASQDEMNDIADMAIRVNDFMCGMFAAIGIRLVDFKLEFGRVWDGDYRARHPRRRDQPRRLPAVGHEVQREARQGPLPPGPRRRGRSLSGSRPPARPAARGGNRASSTSTATARSAGSRPLAWRFPRVRVVTLNAALGPLDYRVPDGMAVEPGSVVVAPLGPAPAARRRLGSRSGCRPRKSATTACARSPACSTCRRSPRRCAASPNGPPIITSRRWPRCCGWCCRPRPRSKARAS